MELDGFDAMLYDGKHWYPKVTTKYLLEEGIVPPESVKYRVKASRIAPPDFLKRMDAEVLGLWNELHVEYDGDNDAEFLQWKIKNIQDRRPEVKPDEWHKEMWNAFLGVCSTNPRLA